MSDQQDAALVALEDAVIDNTEVACMTYCYGGRPRVDGPGVLADLAEQGWQLTRKGGTDA